ncbi:putative TRAP-type C4-dicarboxylate transport system, small permease component [Vibrio nigripulchritudo SFn27]|uniref:TRAP transporter small permease protein n=2 Tax=Vibrio nigripulchritudo TaxID=28173 RepID=U4K887_9VIBR|nr:TRAP transporter small permease [Vibrio nigripulchritudo]CCN82941.1 putative TRAP-type C4-dicarboxylate transport system, small permease component [Vibrio nigripulchritudo BLFn1]CCO52250.1 putative TRAP-type C4-dicarboxylate transport system, small permease component [Vibrio nigripulchritudo Wn13]CCN89587.1 putative TRAP-type C4-dicarboxylate transport system, small permease component [Vibrio nigripulchritudo SFn27]CCN94455.1 putative TRAP-type C4-dicarboxylate transport system, small permea
MNTFKHTLYMLSGYSSGLCIVLMMLIILAQVIGRMFGFIVPSAEDFSGYALAASTFFGLAYAFREGGHIRVTLVIQRLPASVQKYQETAILIFAFLLVTFMSFYCAHMVWESYDFEEVTHGYIPIPLWIPQVPVAIGMIGLNLAVLDNLIIALKGGTPTYKAHEGETQ